MVGGSNELPGQGCGGFCLLSLWERINLYFWFARKSALSSVTLTACNLEICGREPMPHALSFPCTPMPSVTECLPESKCKCVRSSGTLLPNKPFTCLCLPRDNQNIPTRNKIIVPSRNPNQITYLFFFCQPDESEI